MVLKGVNSRFRAPNFWEAWIEKRWPDFFGNETYCGIVMQTKTLEPQFRVSGMRITANGRTDYMLSADATTLVATDYWREGLTVIRIYDVHPARAWCRALGVAFGSAVVWQFGLVRGWRAFRKRKTARIEPNRGL